VRLLITGASGFVGRHLTAVLPARIRWQGLGRRDCDNIVSVDILDHSSLRSVIAQSSPDVVVHLAAVAQSGGEEAVLRRVNVDGAVHVAEATWMAAPDARLIVASTGYVLGETAAAADESVPLAPIGAYAESKAEMERVLARLAGSRALHVVRPFNHAGPGQASTYAVTAFAQKVLKSARFGVPIKVGDLTAVRDLSDVRDLAKVLAWMVQAPDLPPLLHVCSGRPRTMKDVLDAFLVRAGIDPTTARVHSEGRSRLRRNVGNPALCRRLVPVVPRSLEHTLDDVWAQVQT